MELHEAAARLRGVQRIRLAFEAGTEGFALCDVHAHRANEKELERLRGLYRLPEVYVAFLREHVSHAWEDGALVWEGMACWPMSTLGFEDVHLSYADHWADDWIVVAGEYEGCYFLDLGAAEDPTKDAPVRHLSHGDNLSYVEVADSFVGFLEAVADSTDVAIENPFVRAIAHHDPVYIDMLESSSELAHACDEGLSALAAAVVYENEQALERLLEAGADPNAPFAEDARLAGAKSPLALAATCGLPELAKRLLRGGADPSHHTATYFVAHDPTEQSVVSLAIERGDEELLDLALAGGADPEVEGAHEGGRLLDQDRLTLPMLEVLEKHGVPVTDDVVAMTAAFHADVGELAQLDAMLAKYPHLDRIALHETALAGAAGAGLLDVVRAIAARPPFAEAAGYRDAVIRGGAEAASSALQSACVRNQEEAAVLLLELFPGIGSRRNLVAAAQRGLARVVSLLEGVEVNGGDPTPLMAASRQGHVAIVDMLLERGADVHAEDANGNTAFAYARRFFRDDVMDRLREAGAAETKWKSPARGFRPSAPDYTPESQGTTWVDRLNLIVFFIAIGAIIFAFIVLAITKDG